jgi:hypothetical protein
MPAVTISLEEELIERAKAHAERERRSLSSQIAYWIERELAAVAAPADQVTTQEGAGREAAALA